MLDLRDGGSSSRSSRPSAPTRRPAASSGDDDDDEEEDAADILMKCALALDESEAGVRLSLKPLFIVKSLCGPSIEWVAL